MLIGASGPAAIEPPPALISRQAPTPLVTLPLPSPEPDSFPLLASENPSLDAPDSPSSPGAVVSRELVATRLVSLRADGTALNAPALDVALSADGRYVAFTSAANNLIAGARNPDHDGYENVFLVDVQTGEVSLVSAAVDGAPGDGWSSGPALSAGGRYIAYYSWASDLTSDDSNAVQDVFVHDRQYGTNERVSISTRGAQANGRSGDGRLGTRPAISADGRVVAFHSQASNLVEGDTNRAADVFVRDRLTGETARVSVSTQGAQGSDDSVRPALSGDGRVIAFESRAKNLDLARPNPDGISQVYVHDRELGRTDLISFGIDGLAGDAASGDTAISAGGRFVAFSSYATNLVPGDANGAAHIFVYDRQRNTLERVSVSSAGIPANRDALTPALSAGGRYVAYASAASNLVNGDANGAVDIFVHDRLARHTSRASLAVTAAWTGVEADADSYGPSALAADGRFVAFVSAAANLATGDDNGVADVFIHERADLPAYTLAGRIVDTANRPLEGVVVRAGPHSATTGSDGRFAFTHITGGTYTLTAERQGYSFSPQRRTLSVVADIAGVDFVARSDGGPSQAFLGLPLGGRSSPAALWQALRDTDEGGLVDAWFDHDSPTYAKNDAVLLWDGRPRSAARYNTVLGCYERRCYDGHDGIDFPYRDPNPATPDVFEPVEIYPAAAGRVAATLSHCVAGDRWCNGGYGNEVILDHGNGYFTRYAHLAHIGGGPGATLPAQVGPGDVIGVMGSTGNSYGAHLHFAVHRDDGNGRWDGGEQDKPVDPFGWTGVQPDPWAQSEDGAASRWLWLHRPNVEMFVFGSQGATLADLAGAIAVTLPPGALSGQVRLELAPGSPAGLPQDAQRSLGRAFWLRVLDWYAPGAQTGTDALAAQLDQAMTARPLALALDYADADTRRLDMTRAIVQRWDEASQTWLPLPTSVDERTRTVTAEANQLGHFDLQAPLRCPADTLEPDDSYYAAAYIGRDDAPQRRLLDSQDDEDWVRFDASAGETRSVRIDDIAAGVRLTAEIYGLDGLTRLAADSGATGQPLALTWTPQDEGTYFVRVTPAAGSAAGCDASYTISIE